MTRSLIKKIKELVIWKSNNNSGWTYDKSDIDNELAKKPTATLVKSTASTSLSSSSTDEQVASSKAIYNKFNDVNTALGTKPTATLVTNINSGNTDNQVTSSKAIYDKFNEMDGRIDDILTSALGDEVSVQLSGYSPSNHGHGNISNAGAIGSTPNLPIITGTNGVLKAGSFGISANTFCQGNDSRLSDARTPTSHTHGDITNDGKLGSAANKPLITTTGGKIAIGSFESTATNIKMNGTQSVGSSNAFARGDHVHPTDTSRAPTAHASSATTYGVSSASNYGHAMASGTSPKVNGTAAVGSETAKFARGDHVHPTDTTRAASDHSHGNVTNGGLITTADTSTNFTQFAGLNASNQLIKASKLNNSQVIDTTAYANIGSSANASQKTINNNINSKLATFCLNTDSRLSNTRNPTMTAVNPSSSNKPNIDNYYTATGFYNFFNNTNIQYVQGTLPSDLGASSFFLMVERQSDNYAVQRLTRYSDGKTWVRVKNVDNWTSWDEIYSKNGLKWTKLTSWSINKNNYTVSLYYNDLFIAVQFDGTYESNIPSSPTALPTYLPDGYKPDVNIEGMVYAGVHVMILSSGKISIYKPFGTDNKLYGYVTFPRIS